MQESIVFLVRVQCRRKESSRSLSHLLMSFLYVIERIFIAIKGRRPLTHHISSIAITTKHVQLIKMNKLTMQVTKPHRTPVYRINKF